MRRMLLVLISAGAAILAGWLFFRDSGGDGGDGSAMESGGARKERAGSGTVRAVVGAVVGADGGVLGEMRGQSREKVAVDDTEPEAWVEDVFRRLPELAGEAKDAAVLELIGKLRAAGPRGLLAVGKFLESKQDMHFRNGYSMSGKDLVSAPTLRLALIDALREWPGSAGVLLGVVKSDATIWESVLAIRGLEQSFPGTYRTEAVEALKRRIGDPKAWDDTPNGDVYLFDVAAHFRSEELLPDLHALTVKQPFLRSAAYVRMLSDYPEEARGAALDRLIAEPAFVEMFRERTSALNQFSFADERMRGLAVRMFTQEWNAAQRLNALQHLEAVPPGNASTFFSTPRDRAWQQAQSERDFEEARSRAVLLAEIEPKADTPELKEELKKVRERVTSEIAKLANDERHANDPEVEVEFGSGDGKAAIKGRRIQNIELKSAPLVPTPEDDSTPDAPR